MIGKTVIYISVLAICISSCKPSYMRCPKNRRCDATPIIKDNIATAANLYSTQNWQSTSQF